MKKISNYFTHGLTNASELRTTILRSQSVDAAIEAVNMYFDNLAEWTARGGANRLEGPVAEDADSPLGERRLGDGAESASTPFA